jgi:hypothetical protein
MLKKWAKRAFVLILQPYICFDWTKKFLKVAIIKANEIKVSKFVASNTVLPIKALSFFSLGITKGIPNNKHGTNTFKTLSIKYVALTHLVWDWLSDFPEIKFLILIDVIQYREQKNHRAKQKVA